VGCLSCGRGLHTECRKCRKGKCHPDEKEVKNFNKAIGGQGRVAKEADKMQDRFSTGRKRAAVLYPIVKIKDDKEELVLPDCEWKGKRNCGGGFNPIVGCVNGKQQHRHHGPVKDPVHNEPNNVHRICVGCHSKWHAENDPCYDEEEYRQLPHEPEEAEQIELEWAAQLWKKRYLLKGKEIKEDED
jgi:hypothetical protein